METRLKFAAVACLLVASGVHQSARAADDGFFVSANSGMSHSNYSAGYGYDRTDRAFGGLLGYRWRLSNELAWGIEAGYQDLGDYHSASSYVDPVGFPVGSAVWHIGSYSNWRLRAKAALLGTTTRWVLRDRWSLIGHVGLGRASVDEKYDTGVTNNGYSIFHRGFRSHGERTGAYAGFGLGYDVTSRLTIDVTYDRYWFSLHDEYSDKRRSVIVSVPALSVEFRI